MLRSILTAAALFTITGIAAAHPGLEDDAHPMARYLGNEGVLVTHGDTKIVFDAFYDNSYGTYLLVPEEIQDALLKGTPPYDGVDAVFVSHAHGDHFAAAPVIEFMRAQPGVHLYAPDQAVGMISDSLDEGDPVLDRMTGFSLQAGDAPQTVEIGDLTIEAVMIPHAGGRRMAGIHNIVFRVTLNGETTAMHMGDAGPVDANFAPHQDHWDARHSHIAMPPYWFFSSEEGRKVLEERIKAGQSVGIHVPAEAKGNGDAWRENLKGDVFTDPGETRVLHDPK